MAFSASWRVLKTLFVVSDDGLGKILEIFGVLFRRGILAMLLSLGIV